MRFATQKLAGKPSARFEAELLLAHTLESTRSFIYANPELELPYQRSETFKRLVRKRAQGQPIAYLTGRSEFWSLPLEVNRDVLIPRPETELLVETVLGKVPKEADWRIADLGTGSGAIALAIASERKHCEIHATDISSAAIEVALNNAQRLGLARVRFYCGSWGQPLTGKFHIVASNPPYVDANDPHLSRGDLRFEPRTALTPGRDGLEAIRRIARDVFEIIFEGGWLIFEHGWEQGSACRQTLVECGYGSVETLKDLQGHERVTIGGKSG